MKTPVTIRGRGRRFHVPLDAVAGALRELGLQHPVAISVVPMGNFDGRYIGLKNGVHRISVRARSSPRRASWTLWHELGHAMQSERLGSGEAFAQQWDAEARAAGIQSRDLR